MDIISKKIAHKVAINQNLDKEKEAVIAYGTFTLLQTIVSILLIITIGAIIGVAIEALVISLVTSIFRKFTGGVHATSPLRCLILGTIICLFQAIIIVYIIVGIVDIKVVVISGFIIFVFAHYFVRRFAPVESVNKPLSDEKKKRMKNYAIKLLNIYIIVCLILLILSKNVSYEYLKYILSIFSGILWQIFTMGKLGDVFILKIDSLLKKNF